MRGVVVACLLLLAGCDLVLLSKNEYVPPDALLTCLVDPFDPPLSNNWDALPTTGEMPILDGGQLKIPHSMLGGQIEVTSNQVLDFTGGNAQVVNLETLPTTLGFATTYFGFGLDADNAYAMAVFSNNGLQISFLIRENKTDTNVVMPFNAQTFKYWRFVHVPSTNMVEYYTSETGALDNWALRFSTPAKIDLQAIKFSIGTTSSFGGGMGAMASYDDFEFCRPL